MRHFFSRFTAHELRETVQSDAQGLVKVFFRTSCHVRHELPGEVLPGVFQLFNEFVHVRCCWLRVILPIRSAAASRCRAGQIRRYQSR